MFSKILGKKKNVTDEEENHNTELLTKISKMNLVEMRSYVNNKIADLPLCEDGLSAIISKLIEPNEQTNKLYLQNDDMDTKKRKAFELILLMAKSQKITFKTVEGMQKFLEVYDELIKSYDKEHKDIYIDKLSSAVKLALNNIEEIAALKSKMELLGEN
jgi:hypothetical protein